MSQGYDNFFKAAKRAKKNSSAPKKKSEQTAEDVLRNALKLRAKKKKKKKSSFPLSSLTFLSIGLVVTSLGVMYPEGFEELADQVEISWTTLADAQDKSSEEKTSQTKKEDVEKTAASRETAAIDEKALAKNWTPEQINNFSKLNDRKRELDHREGELAELEAELHKQKREIEARIEKLVKIRAEISGVLQDKVNVDEQKVKKLVDFYSNMKPQKAAEILGTINEDLAVEVLSRMKKKNAADILNLIEPKKAQTLSEKFAGYKRR